MIISATAGDTTSIDMFLFTCFTDDNNNAGREEQPKDDNLDDEEGRRRMVVSGLLGNGKEERELEVTVTSCSGTEGRTGWGGKDGYDGHRFGGGGKSKFARKETRGEEE